MSTEVCYHNSKIVNLMLDSSHESPKCIFSDEISYESIKNMTLL